MSERETKRLSTKFVGEENRYNIHTKVETTKIIYNKKEFFVLSIQQLVYLLLL